MSEEIVTGNIESTSSTAAPEGQTGEQPGYTPEAGAGTTTEQTAGEGGEQQPKRDTTDPGVKRVIAELRREAREAKAAAERERQERLSVTQQMLQRGTGQPQAVTPGDGPPDAAKYAGGEFNPEYVRDMARHEARSEFRAQVESYTKRQQEDRTRQERETAQQAWNEAVSKAQTKYDDFEVVVEASASEIPAQVRQLLVALDDGAELLYTLAKDTSKAKTLTGNPVKVAAALGELRAEARIAAKAAAAAKAADDANATPINPAGGTGRGSGEPNPADTARWIAWRRRQLAKDGTY